MGVTLDSDGLYKIKPLRFQGDGYLSKQPEQLQADQEDQEDEQNLSSEYAVDLSASDTTTEPLRTGYGDRFNNQSVYDKEIMDLTKLDEGYSANNLRGIQQSGAMQLLNGVAKNIVTAGTTFLEDVGLLYGLGRTVYDGLSGQGWNGNTIMDNGFTRALHDIREQAEEILPNYYTKEEEEGNFWDNLGTANFWGDKFIKNLGFTEGMLLSTAVFAPVGALTKAMKALNASQRAIQAGGMFVRTLIASATEGAEEGLSTTIEMYNKNKQLADLKRQKALEQASLNSISSYDYETQRFNIEKAYQEDLQVVDEASRAAGNLTFGLNMPILMASNLAQWGRLFAKSYSATKLIEGNLTKNIVDKAGKKVAQYATNPTRLGVAIGKGSMRMLEEGSEEMSQAIASNFAKNAYEQQVMQHFNPDNKQIGIDWVKAATEAFYNTLSDKSAWEEFGIGALTGALGAPTFGRAMNSTTETYLGRNMPVGITGGVLGEIASSRENNRMKEDLANRLNNRVQSDKYQKFYNDLGASMTLEDLKTQLEVIQDEKQFKDADASQLFYDIQLFMEAGIIDDLKETLGKEFEATDEDIKTLLESTTSFKSDNLQNTEVVGPYVEVGATQSGNRTKDTKIKAELINSRKKTEDIRAKVNKNRQDLLDAIDRIVAIQNEIALDTNNRLGQDQLAHLTYLKFRAENSEKRYKQLAKEISDQIRNLNDFDNDESFSLLKSLLDIANDSWIQQIKNSDPNNAGSFYNKLLQAAQKESGLNSIRYLQFKSDLQDLRQLTKDTDMFNEAYSKYIKNPQKQAEDIAAYKARKTAEKKSKISEEIKKGVTDDTSYSEFADKVAEIYKRNQDVNIDDILSDLSNSKDTSRQLKNLLQTHATNANMVANYISAIQNEENLSDEEKQSAINALLNLQKESESVDELQEKINNLVNDTDMNQDAFDLIKQHLVETVKQTIEAQNKKKGTAPNASAKQASNIKSSTPQQPAVKKPVQKNGTNKKTEPTVNPLPVTFEQGGSDNSWTTSLFHSDWSAFGIERTPESQNTSEVPTKQEFEDFENSDAYNNMPEYVDYSQPNESNEFRPSKYAYYVYKYLCQKGAFTDNPLKVKPVGNQAPKVTFVNQSIETELGGYERVTLIYYNYKDDKNRGLLVGTMVGNVSSQDNATEFLKAAVDKDSTELPTSTNINRDSIGNGQEKDVIVAESTVRGYKGARVPLKDLKNETEHKENPLKEVITSDDEIAVATSQGLETSTGRTIPLSGLEKGTTYVIIDKASDGTQTDNVFPFPIYVHPFSETPWDGTSTNGLYQELQDIATKLLVETSKPETFQRIVTDLNKDFNKLIFIPRLSQEGNANSWFNIEIQNGKNGKSLKFKSNITGLPEQYISKDSINLNNTDGEKVYEYMVQELKNLDKYISDKTEDNPVLGHTEYDGVRFNVDLSRIKDKEYRQKLLDTEGFLTINLEKNQLRVSGGVLKINPLIPSTKAEKPKFEVGDDEDYIGYMNEPMPEQNVEVLPEEVEQQITGQPNVQQQPSNPVFKPVSGGKTFTVLGGNNIITTGGKQGEAESTDNSKPEWISKSTNDDDTETEIEISEDMTIPKAQFNKGKITNLAKELKWLSERLPKLSNQVLIKIVNDAIENKGDTVTVGRLQNHTMLLSKKAPNGVVYHESFHGVLAFILSPIEKQKLYRQLHQLFDYRIPKDVMSRIKDNKISYDLAVEEIAAEDFRLYMIRQDRKQQGSFIQRLFAKIKDFIDSFNDNYNDIQNFYNKIRNGQIADNQPVSSSEAAISYTEDSYWKGKTYDSLDSQTQENVSRYLKNHNTNSVKFDNLPNETKRLILQCVMF